MNAEQASPTRRPRAVGSGVHRPPAACCACARARSPYTGREATERAQRASRPARVSHRLDESEPHRFLRRELARLVELTADLVVLLPPWLSGELEGDPDGELFWLQARLEDLRDGAAQALAGTEAMRRQLDAELDARLSEGGESHDSEPAVVAARAT